MNILQKIITSHYEEIKYTLHPRHSVMENIDRTTAMSFKIIHVKHRNPVLNVNGFPLIKCMKGQWQTLRKREVISMDRQHIRELRQKYIQNPPEGMSAKDIKNMSSTDLLDMDYFLHGDVFDEESFYIF